MRVSLMGHALEIAKSDGSDSDNSAADAVAHAYFQALRDAGLHLMRLVPDSEMAPTLGSPLGASLMNTVHLKPGEAARYKAMVTAARTRLLAPCPALQRAYKYLDNARVAPVKFSELYKAIETIEHEFGGEQQTIRALKVDHKSVKRLANERINDERHAPASEEAVKPIDEHVAQQAIEQVIRLIEAYADSVS
jgi:hypothetical protein